MDVDGQEKLWLLSKWDAVIFVIDSNDGGF